MSFLSVPASTTGYFHEKKSKVRIDTEGSKLDDTATNKTDPTSVLRNKNLNRGILKPKDPIKYTESARPIKDEKKEKNLLNSERMNKVDNKETKDEVERTRMVPGGTNYVPSKDAKKDLNNKPKEIINNKVKEKEPKKERESKKERDPKDSENKPLKEKEITIGEIKEDSCMDSGEWCAMPPIIHHLHRVLAFEIIFCLRKS